MSFETQCKQISDELSSLDMGKISHIFPFAESAVRSLEALQGHEYGNKNIALAALLHRSILVHWPHDKLGIITNERLEFLGDAFLNLFAATMAMTLYPNWNEGELSKLRAATVGAQWLAQKSKTLGISALVILGKGEQKLVGSAGHENIHADAFEAVTAAILIDGGFASCWKWLHQVFSEDFNRGTEILSRFDAKSRFQQWLQAIVGETPTYKVVGTNSTHEKTEFIVSAYIGHREIDTVSATNKRLASKMLAEKLMKMVENGELTPEMVTKYCGVKK